MFQKTVLNSPVEHWLSEKKTLSNSKSLSTKTLNQDSKLSIK